MIDILHQKPLLGRQINWAHPLAHGMVSCWLFNEGSGSKVYDIASHRYDLDFNNSPVWSLDKFGHSPSILFNSSLSQFLGRGDLCGISDYPFSVSLWFFPLNDSHDHTIFSFGDTNAAPYQRIRLRNTPDDDISAVSFDGSSGQAVAGDTYTVNSWNHICAVYASNTSRAIYLNGGNKGTNATDIDFDAGLDNTTIGAQRTGGGSEQFSSGKIDIPMIWNRVLFDDEVEWLFREPIVMFQQNRARMFSVGGIAVFASISDSFGISDTIVTKTGYIRSAADSVGISDVLTRIATYIRSLASNLATTDTINTARNLKRSTAENVGVTDTVTIKKSVFVILADALSITDVITRIITFVRSIPDALAISDTLTTIRSIVRSIADGVGITDVLTSEKFILVAIADNVGITDTLTTIGTFIRSVIDGLGISDIISRIGTFIRSESDSVGVTDVLTPTKGVFRSIADGVGITDVLAAIVGKLSSIVTTLGITDVLTFIRTTVVGGRVFIKVSAPCRHY